MTWDRLWNCFFPKKNKYKTLAIPQPPHGKSSQLPLAVPAWGLSCFSGWSRASQLQVQVLCLTPSWLENSVSAVLVLSSVGQAISLKRTRPKLVPWPPPTNLGWFSREISARLPHLFCPRFIQHQCQRTLKGWIPTPWSHHCPPWHTLCYQKVCDTLVNTALCFFF